MKSGKWSTKLFVFKEKEKYENGMGGFVWVEDFLPNKLIKCKYGELFTYLYRRFGIHHTGDKDREIARWILTTPDENVALVVSPRPSGITHSFGYVINRKTYRGRMDSKQVLAVQSALSAAMLDLLFPVWVRDIPINCLGIMDVEDAVMMDDEGCDEVS